MASRDELNATLRARMEEILRDARTLERSSRSTITPNRSHADAPGRHAIALLERLGHGSPRVVVKGVLGEGGMGIVWAGEQVALGREVAVKTLREEVVSETAMLKLLREAWVTGSLEHTNIVPVHDISLDGQGRPQIVLKKIAGTVWSSVMRDEKAIRQRFQARDPFEWNVRILMEVCNAAHFAHSRGIIHRDLKPDNVMIGEFGEVYVLDWGIAVSLHDDGSGRLPLAKDAIELAGTPAYLAPEMLGGGAHMLSPRTDVYLLGAILYEVATGRPPHMGATLGEILHQVVASRPPLLADTPAELERIIRRAMDPDPDARFETALQLRLALAGFLEHRGSLKLAAEAERRLLEIEEERATAGADPDEQRARLYNLFGECRFGFLQALRIWPDNDQARDGLRRAISTMVELELDQGDPKAAALLLAELEQPPAELVERVQQARVAHEAEEARRAALARDFDPSIGRRTRVWVGTALGLSWTIFPWIGLAWEQAHPETDQRTAIAGSLAALFACAGIAYWARDSLSRTAINRRLVRSVGIALVAQTLLFATTYMLGVAYAAARVLLLGLYGVCAGLCAATIESRLWPTALGYLIALAIASVRPSWAYPLQSLADFMLTVNVVAIWGRIDEDVVAPLKQRTEHRMRAWHEFLERKRLRESRTTEEGGLL